MGSIFQTEEPYLTIPLPMLSLYNSISKNNIKVTLDGHGADEMFSGYGHLAALIDTKSYKISNQILNILESLAGYFNSNKTHNILAKVIARFKYRAGKSYFLDLYLRLLVDNFHFHHFILKMT